jgi:cation diffusion facilitator family transporter
MHDHIHSHERHAHAERGTRFVFWLTMVTMAAEIFSGWLFGSMALLADGWHMAGHAGAMAVAWLAYIYTRKNATNPDLIFGAGKINTLAGFASAVGLFLVAVYMAAESTMRLFSPVDIAFLQATVVAVLGLVVNLVSAWMLRDEDHSHSHDHNLKAAYLHVLADALTSILAIFALLAGKFLGLNRLDPLAGLVGALLIGRWSIGLLCETARILLDFRAQESLHDDIRRRLEADGQITIHRLDVWNVGAADRAAQLSLTDHAQRPPNYHKELLSHLPGLVHVTVEIQPAEARHG